MVDLNGTPDTYIAGMMDAARIVRERKGKYTLEQTASYLEALCTSQSSPTDPIPTNWEWINQEWSRFAESQNKKPLEREYPEPISKLFAAYIIKRLQIENAVDEELNGSAAEAERGKEE